MAVGNPRGFTDHDLSAVDDSGYAASRYGREILDRVKDRYAPDQAQEILEGIEDAAEQIRTKGFYTSVGAWQKDVNAVSVPFRSQQPDTPMLAFNLGGYAYSLPKERLENELGPKLVELARKVSRAE